MDALWDPGRDVNEPVRPDDWYPHRMTPGERALYVDCGDPPNGGPRAGEGGRYRGADSVRSRRLLYVNLHPSTLRRI